ncbi:MAG TPA: twin-arginine translocase TatA/TatE family subunit [bacterium]|jgi:sec-independent protein translocase protein TatA|nr:twin-arginine translocase TatA/TatE family subunit [bacterium]HOC89559.1 twin-arginine translocase TatA/TatE family subunit [bacterium]HOZ22484.1 twin-arginine translocase TatA/TatE family subunit [bacterium]
MLPGIGVDEMFVIVLVALILFGSKQLPELARGLGKAMRELKKATDDVKRELDVTEELRK